MKLLDLFSGIGGFSLAASWVGWETVQFVEIDKFCQKVLNKHWPNVPIHSDIKDFDGTRLRNTIDIISGGFPCQPFSVAGKQGGKSDDRFLWPEMLRVIREIQPPWIVGENVPGIIRMELDNICTSLENEGYEVQPFIIPSASVGAWDKRDRVWIIAYNQKSRKRRLSIQQRGQNKTSDADANREVKINSDTNQFNSDNAGYNSGSVPQQQEAEVRLNKDIANTISGGRKNGLYGEKSERKTGECGNDFKESDWWKRNWIEVASELCRSNARVPHRLDRIKGLGNSVNPYVSYEIFKAINEFEQSLTQLNS